MIRSRRLDTWRSEGSRINLGSGDHQNIGSPGLYQGNIPWRYARISLGMLRSPPTAKSPSSLASLGGGKSRSPDSRYTGIIQAAPRASVHKVFQTGVLYTKPKDDSTFVFNSSLTRINRNSA